MKIYLFLSAAFFLVIPPSLGIWQQDAAYWAKKSVTEYSDGIYVGYRYFDKKNIEPLFTFWYCLSYSQFDYKNLSSTHSADAARLEVEVSLDFSNTGMYDGAEVVQLYIQSIASFGDKPVKELKI